MVRDQHGQSPVWQVNVHVGGTDTEIVEHAAELLQAGAVAGVLSDCHRLPAADNGCAACAQAQTFCGCGCRDRGPQPPQLLPQLCSVPAWLRFQLDLGSAEFAADAVAQRLRGSRDDFWAGLCGRPRHWIDDKVLLLDTDGRRRPGAFGTLVRPAQVEYARGVAQAAVRAESLHRLRIPVHLVCHPGSPSGVHR
jgi:hypothetical protein